MIAAILEREPDWEALPPETPPLARSVLRRSLRKQPRRRFHVSDVRVEREEAVREPRAEVHREPAVRSGPPAGLAWTLAAVLLAAVLGLLWWAVAIRERSGPAAPARFHLQPPPGSRRSTPRARERSSVPAWPSLPTVFPDGEQFLVRREPPASAEGRRIVYVPDWTDELRTR